MHDLALAIRLLRKSPAFTFLALLCLALGIGVNASIFSLLDSVYLRPLPVGNADHVVVLSRGGSPRFPYPEYRALRDRNQSLDGLAVSEPDECDLSFEGNAMLIGAEPVSANYAVVLGARTSLGRWFTREDEPVAVISYHAWQQLFHGDPLGFRELARTSTITGAPRVSWAAKSGPCGRLCGQRTFVARPVAAPGAAIRRCAGLRLSAA